MNRIREIVATPVSVPFTKPERWAFGEHRGMSSIIVQMHTEDGRVGLGEVLPGGPGPKALLAAIEEATPLLIGREATDIEANVRRLMYVGGWYMFARTGNLIIAGLETAMWDILGQHLGVPLYRLFGGKLRPRISYMYWTQAGAPVHERVAEAREAVRKGFRTIYTKGGWDDEADVEIIAKLREALGPQIRLRLDANESWSVGTAVRMLRRLEPYDLEFVEQPVRLDDLDAMCRIRGTTAVPIGANQSGWTGQRVLEIIRRGAADVIVTDPMQEGGLSAFRRTVGMCEIAGLPVVHHAFSGLTIAMTASMHVLCASSNCLLDHQAYAPMFLGGDVTTVPHDISGGSAAIPDVPGLGVRLDQDRLAEAARRFRDDGFYSMFDEDAEITWIPTR
ncbi:MAG: mandelate racemase/muconate lactonizing enzyme family protein [Dongiaceae bacterium]